MTDKIMDYKERYEKALKRAEAAIDIAADKDLVKGVATTIFPELAESEDERVRKAIVGLIEELQRSDKNFAGVELTDMLAYLDKQKEPHYTKRNALFDKCVAECDPEIMQRVSDEIDEMLWKEQSTNESFDSLFDDYCDAHPDGLTLEECGKFFFSKGKLVATNDFSLALAERYCQGLRDGQEEHWNPTEEDVTLFNKAITTNKSLTPDERAKLDIIRMKFKHRPVIKQKEQKPAEWSEEDEYRRESVVEWLRDHQKTIDRNSNNQAYESIESLISWLKSLRTHWKPSEELIGCLERVIAFKHPEPEDIDGCNSLIEQLKKLM